MGRSSRRLARDLANDQSEWVNEAQALYRILLSPVGPLPAGRTLAIIGTDLLGGVPFEALADENGAPVLSTHPVVYVNSLIDSESFPTEPVSSGHNVFLGINTPRLGYPEVEAKSLAWLTSAQTLLGSEATVNNVRRAFASARIAHIAAHGVLDARNPYRSHLLLADTPLETWQLFQDARRTELLVLSACDTRRAPESSLNFGDAQSSLTAIALEGGTRRIISSLWAAGDEPAANVMEAFYQEPRCHPDDLTGALQRAKLREMERSHGHPGLSMSFVLSVRSPNLIKI